MPYITKERAKQIDSGQKPTTEGDLNYVLSSTVAGYLRRKYGDSPSYAERAECHESLNAAADEYYRRVMAPYEDKKLSDDANVDPYEIF